MQKKTMKENKAVKMKIEIMKTTIMEKTIKENNEFIKMLIDD